MLKSVVVETATLHPTLDRTSAQRACLRATKVLWSASLLLGESLKRPSCLGYIWLKLRVSMSPGLGHEPVV